MPSAAPSDPRVVISAGTRSRVMQKPLNSPHDDAADDRRHEADERGAVALAADPAMTLTAQMPAKTSTEPIDRSKPAATITYVMPTAITRKMEVSTIDVAARWPCGNVSGDRTLKTMNSTISTPNM